MSQLLPVHALEVLEIAEGGWEASSRERKEGAGLQLDLSFLHPSLLPYILLNSELHIYTRIELPC